MNNSNRAEQLWKNWEEKQMKLKSLTGDSTENGAFIKKLKYDFLREGLYRILNPTAQERLYFSVIRLMNRNLQKELYPNPVLRMLHQIKANLWDKPRHFQKFSRQREINLRELNTAFKKVGLGTFSGKLENYLDYETSHVQVQKTSEINNNNRLDVTANLISDGLGRYKFDGFHAAYLPKGSLENSRAYTFSSESGITAKQAVNMLEGRAVMKLFENSDGTVEKKWQQLDFTDGNPKMKEFHSDYNYDLTGILSRISAKIGIQGLTNEKLIKGLEDGNMLSLDIPGKGRFSMQADPAGQMVNFFDRNRNPVIITSLFKKAQQKGLEASNEIKTVKLHQRNNKENQSLMIR